MSDYSVEGIRLLRRILLEAGLAGLPSRDLQYSLRNTDMRKDEIDSLLRDKHLVQRFILPSPKKTGGRPTTIWRATTLLAEYKLFSGEEL